VLNGGVGNDVLIGDGAMIIWEANSIKVIESIDPLFGGNDKLDGGSGNNIMIGGAGNDLFVGDIQKDLMIGETGKVTMDNGKVQSVTVSGTLLNLIDFAQSGLFHSSSGRKQDEGSLSSIFESISGMRRSGLQETNFNQDKFAGNPEMQQTRELSYHSGSLLTAQNKQQIIDFFQKLELKEDGSEMPVYEKPEGNAVVPPVEGSSREENTDMGSQQLNALESGQRGGSKPGAEKEDSNMTLGNLIAGYMGWQVYSTLPSERKERINSDSFTKLERRERNRRFQKWN
jgi:hypothetical protein